MFSFKVASKGRPILDNLHSLKLALFAGVVCNQAAWPMVSQAANAQQHPVSSTTTASRPSSGKPAAQSADTTIQSQRDAYRVYQTQQWWRTYYNSKLNARTQARERGQRVQESWKYYREVSSPNSLTSRTLRDIQYKNQNYYAAYAQRKEQGLVGVSRNTAGGQANPNVPVYNPGANSR
jgi:hypothetical protein